jgi:hypothetical protein
MKRLWLAIKTFLSVARLPKGVEWNEQDGQALRAFLATPSGAKVPHLLLARIVQFNEWATVQSNPNACGQAVGFKLSYSYLISLATAQSGKSEQPADNNGTAGPLDHLRP